MSQIGSWTGEGPRIPRRDTRHFSTWASAYRLRCGHRHQTTTHRRQEYHWPTLLHQAINSLQLCLVASAAECGGGGEDLEQSNGLNRLHHAAYDTTETTMSMGPRRCPYRDRPCLDWTPVVLDAYPLRAVRALGPRITCITLHDTETTGPLHPTLCDLSRHGRPSYCLNIRVIIDCINGHLDEAPLTMIPDAPWASSLSLGRQEPYPRRLGSLGSHCFFRLPAFQSITPRIHQCSDGAWVAICAHSAVIYRHSLLAFTLHKSANECHLLRGTSNGCRSKNSLVCVDTGASGVRAEDGPSTRPVLVPAVDCWLRKE